MSSPVEAAQRWLKQSGLRLEFEVAAAFRSHGFDAYQGLHYAPDRDDATGGREIDVVAVRDRITGSGPASRGTAAFVIECKSGASPWIVVASDSPADAWGAVDYLPMTGSTSDDIVSVLEEGEEPWLFGLPQGAGSRVLAMSNQRSGRDGLRDPATRRGQDPPYDAIRQVLSAAKGVVKQSPSHVPMAVVPVVVTAGPLLRASFGGGDEPEVVVTPFERLVWRGDLSGNPSIVDVVSAESIHEYCRMADAGADELLPILRRVSLERRHRAMEAQGSSSLERLLSPVIAAGDAVAGLFDVFTKRPRLWRQSPQASRNTATRPTSRGPSVAPTDEER